MIRLVTRESVFRNPFAAAVIRPRQDAVKEGGIEDFDPSTGITGQEDLSGEWCDSPPVQEGHHSLKNSVLSLPSASLAEFEKNFPDKLTGLLTSLGMRDFYLMLALKTDWFIQLSDVPSAREALGTLSRFTGKQSYNEAYSCGLASLPLLALTAFRLGRYCAALPEAFFIESSRDFAFRICRYGNFHLEMGQTVHSVLTEFLKAGFVPIDRETERWG